jgi:hypothetical protein
MHVACVLQEGASEIVRMLRHCAYINWHEPQDSRMGMEIHIDFRVVIMTGLGIFKVEGCIFREWETMNETAADLAYRRPELLGTVMAC